MDRRKFLRSSATATALAGCSATAPSRLAASDAREGRSHKPVKMHVGTQRGPTSAKMLDFFKRHGVDNICGYPPDPGRRGHWTVADLEQTRDLCEKHGVSLDVVALPFLTSSHVDREKRPGIMLARDPQRDRDIEDVQKMIAACAKAGIPCIKYNVSLLGVLRTGRPARCTKSVTNTC